MAGYNDENGNINMDLFMDNSIDKVINNSGIQIII